MRDRGRPGRYATPCRRRRSTRHRKGTAVKSTLALARSFDRPVKLLLVNQLTINTGFYMLMPYLAGHLSGTLALPAALVGLILGVRNLSQQGMFLVGGTPAERAYLAQEAGERKIEAFAAFNAFYQLGILIGPLIGLVLNGIAFKLVCLTAGLMFAALTIAQTRALPAQAKEQ